MTENNITFNDRKINKSNFYRAKRLFKIDDIDADKISISKKEPYGKIGSFKYFIAYDDNGSFGPLCIMLSRMIGYVNCFDNNKTMSFKITDYNLLKKYTTAWERVSNLMNIAFDVKSVYGDNGNINT